MMVTKVTPLKLILIIFIVIFAFYINYYYANKGLYPIDTFSFFDTAYYITKGVHPIKDFWVISGILIDYIQSIFFYIFGFNWNAYVFHASTFNVLISLFFFYFVNKYEKDVIYSFVLAISVAILCYPIIGTPFPYQHSLILSIVSLLVFYLAISEKNKIFWILLPTLMFFSFLSMQLPSGLINLLIILFSIYHFIFIDKVSFKYFFIGTTIPLLIISLFFIITGVEIKDFITQIFLFPLEFGQNRIVSGEKAFEEAKLINKLTFRGTIGHLKFIFFFIMINIIILFFNIKRSRKKFWVNKSILLNIFILACTLSFIFHQLITANQTFIFVLIPILCGLMLIQLNIFKSTKINKLKILFIVLTIFSTLKYHIEYNENRKFMDLQNVNLNNSVSASNLDKRFKNLKWITPRYGEKNMPQEELLLINEALAVLKKDKSNKMLITHYQFFSTILNENLNIPNRWYYNNNTFPSSDSSKYFNEYADKFKSKINKNKIKTIYVVESGQGEFDFMNYEKFLGSNCYKKKIYSKILYTLELDNCN